MSKAAEESKKIISIKKISEINNRKGHEHKNNSLQEHQDSLQINIDTLSQQLHALEQQKEKMLQDIKIAINKEKEAWIEQKEIEKQKAKEVGYQIGYDAGQEAALSEHQSQLEEANRIVQNATKDYYRTVEKHKEAIIQLAISVAEKIVKKKISKDHEYFTSLISKAIEELKDQSNVAIYLHPEDYQYVFEQKEELEQVIRDGDILSIYVDQHLKKGDCMIKHPFGQIDVSIDLQLQQIKNALEEKVTESS